MRPRSASPAGRGTHPRSGQARRCGQTWRPRRREEGVMAYLLQGLLTEAAARHPQRPAVSSEGCVLTYTELDQLTNKLARALLRLGVAPGDRVGILASKSAAAAVAVLRALKAGAG